VLIAVAAVVEVIAFPIQSTWVKAKYEDGSPRHSPLSPSHPVAATQLARLASARSRYSCQFTLRKEGAKSGHSPEAIAKR
jgi:hypothetical protein